MCMLMKKSTKFSYKQKIMCNVVLGMISLVLGSALLIVQTNIMSYIAEVLLQLHSNSFIFELWRKFPIEIPTSFVFFNWTNQGDFCNKSIKPKLQEIGPYRFLQSMEKVNISWNDNNTVTFKIIRTYRYDDEYPNNGNLSDEVTMINYFTMSAGHRMQHWNNIMKTILHEYLEEIDPYHYFNTTVDNEILKGNENFIIELGNYLDFIVPEIPRFGNFGWLKMRNGDPNFEGVFNIANGINRQFEVLNWNYYSNTPYFEEPCSKVRGSLGDIHSVTENKEFIYVFISDMCRYVKLYFQKEVIVNDILGYKYSFNKLSLDNGTILEENKCFCNGDCIPSGVFNLSTCQYGLNGYSSLPHFYNADPVYANAFEGLSPEENKHEAYLVLEPNTMILLDFKLRIQINILTHPVEGVSFFDEYPKLYFPLFWIEQKSSITDDVKFYLKAYLAIPHVIFTVGTALLILGSCLMACAIFKMKKPETSKTLYNNGTIIPAENTPLNQNITL